MGAQVSSEDLVMCLPIFAAVGVAMGASASSAAAVGTAAVISAVATVASTALGVTSSIEQGSAQKKAASQQAQYYELSALSTESAAAQQAADQMTKARRVAASGQAAAAAGGVDPVSGSPLAIASQSIEFGELDSLRIINNAQNQAWGLNTQAGFSRYQGQQQQTAGIMTAGTTLLGQASNASFKYMDTMNQ